MSAPRRRAPGACILAAATVFVGGGLPVGPTPLAAESAYTDKGADTCLACHDDEKTLALFRTRHAIPGDAHGPFGHGQLQCEACHGPGDAHAGRVRRGQTRAPIISFGGMYEKEVAVENGMCLGCHQGDVGLTWHGGPHGGEDIACSSCHTLHAARDPVAQIALQPEVCFACHRIERTETLKAFAHPMFENKMECTSCHSVHGDAVATSLVRQTVNDTCYQCHADKRGPWLWEHAPVGEDCGLCHAPHGSNNPGMLTRRGPFLCQGCHSQAGHPSVAYDAGDLRSDAASRFLLGQNCLNCHSQVHGSNHPSGSKLMR